MQREDDGVAGAELRALWHKQDAEKKSVRRKKRFFWTVGIIGAILTIVCIIPNLLK